MMMMRVKSKPVLILALFHTLLALFSFSHGDILNGNLPVPTGGNFPVPKDTGNLPVPDVHGELPGPLKDGNLPVPGGYGNLPGPWKDGNLQVPFSGDFAGMADSMREKMARARLGNGTNIILAEKQTRRKDPLDHLNYYKGGWNITNRHYQASVAFSSFPFLVIASLWFVLFGLLMLCACCCCNKSFKSYRCSPLAYVLCLVFLILFTIATIAGCGVLFDGEKRLVGTVYEASNYIVDQAKKISDGLTRVCVYLKSARSITLDKKFLPPDVLSQIDSAASQLDEHKDTPYLTAKGVADTLSKILKHVNIALISITTTLLLVVFLGFLFSVLGWQTLVYIFVIIGWIITTLTFVLCGALLAFHNLMTDTCTAVDEWVQSPTAGSAIKEFLPCVDKEFSKEMMEASKSVSNGINNLLNFHVSLVANADNIPPQAVGLYYNQSGPSLPTICDQHSAGNFIKQDCGEGEVALANATQEWSKSVCQVSSNGICSTQGRLTPDLHKQMSSAANISYALSNFVPFVASLVDCSLIWEILNYMHQHYCPGLMKHSQRVYIGLLVSTISVMFCLVSWVFYGKERQDRKNTERNGDTT
ncbi:hypothetical protein like AT2G12400 [Hibiscus trionum]|uniref:Transmembrane protein n=1 Tax=Hibiscus trionum TaxID=183268 RepID=A0A9W7HI19_HIBTR|nr:hypothetical protein like AT2G12400 [Hibiscus trionum]